MKAYEPLILDADTADTRYDCEVRRIPGEPGCRMSRGEVHRLIEALTEWADAHPEPFPFQDGDLLKYVGNPSPLPCCYVEDGVIRYLEHGGDSLGPPSKFIKVGRLDK